MELLLQLPLEESARLTKELLPADYDFDSLKYKWVINARDTQYLPPGDWRQWLICAGRGFGKALSLDTELPTPYGWTTMGAVKVGDLVFDEQGKQAKVIGKSEILYNRDVYKVCFSDGAEIIADASHLWTVEDKPYRKSLGRRTVNNKQQRKFKTFLKTLTTKQLSQQMTSMDGHEKNWSIPTTKPLELPEIAMPIKPYVLGAWLGDGSSADSCITLHSKDSELLELIKSEGYEVPETLKQGVNTVAIGFKKCSNINGKFVSNGSLYSKLKSLNLLKNKHIPLNYLRCSTSQRLALLQGLMDTDGHITPNGHAEFCTVKQSLASSVFELVISLGFKPAIYVGDAKINGRFISKKYRVCFTPYSNLNPFRLNRKAALVKAAGKQSLRQTRRYIESITLVKSVPVQCIAVDSPNQLYLASRHMIPTHNTRTGSETVRHWIKNYQYVNIIGATADDARDVMIEGESGILACCPPSERPTYKAHKRLLEWPNGGKSLVFSADQPDRLRGKQHMKLLVDELCAWRYPESYTQAMLGLRLGDNPQVIITTTPRPIKIIKEILNDPLTHVTRGSTYDNRGNLAPQFIEQIIKKYEGTRIGRQELYAEILDDNPSALWQLDRIDELRIKIVPDNLRRIIVAIDPAVSNTESSCETGIVVAGVDAKEHGYILEDCTMSGTADQWASRAVRAYHEWGADRIIGEANNGGDLIEAIIRSKDRSVAYQKVFATRGKTKRAEPISALYEQSRIHHVGSFPKLEDQMVSWNPLLPDGQQDSPDRMDALVWGLSHLMLKPVKEFLVV